MRHRYTGAASVSVRAVLYLTILRRPRAIQAFWRLRAAWPINLDAVQDQMRAYTLHGAAWHSGSLLSTVPLLGNNAIGLNFTTQCQSDTDLQHLPVMPLRSNTGPLRVAADPARLLGDTAFGPS
jgi:hypothetical protein